MTATPCEAVTIGRTVLTLNADTILAYCVPQQGISSPHRSVQWRSSKFVLLTLPIIKTSVRLNTAAVSALQAPDNPQDPSMDHHSAHRRVLISRALFIATTRRYFNTAPSVRSILLHAPIPRATHVSVVLHTNLPDRPLTPGSPHLDCIVRVQYMPHQRIVVRRRNLQLHGKGLHRLNRYICGH